LARQAIDRMLVRVGDDRLEHVPQAEPVRRALLEDALAFYRELEKREPADASLQGEVAYAQANAANLHRQLGRLPDALAAGSQGLELLETLIGVDPANPRLFRLRAMAASTLARVRANLGETRQAEALFRSAIADLARATLLVPALCLLGCTASDGPARSEASQLSHAIDSLRNADNTAKPPHLQGLRDTACSVPEVCAVRSACVAGYELHLRGLSALAGAQVVLADAGAEAAARVLDQAKGDLERAHALTEQCTEAQGEMVRKYRVSR
jgi:tetratricopeptide (TPR) repeat protein